MLGKFFRKESEAHNLMQQHIEVVEKAVDSWREALLFYFKGGKEDFEKKALLTIKMESEADKVRRDAELLLYQGAYLPTFREDLLSLLELVDTIADDAERGVDFIRIENPEIPPTGVEKLKIIVEKNHEAFISFKEAYDVLYKRRSDVLSYTHKVQEAEKEVDALQDELMKVIFQSELSLAHKIQLRDLILTIGFISDSSENASDRVALMAVKGRI